MPEIKGVAHFSIPVSDVDRSVKFYTDIVGCKLFGQRPDKGITFLDAGGVCVLLIKKAAPIVTGTPESSDGVHHAFIIDGAPLIHPSTGNWHEDSIKMPSSVCVGRMVRRRRP